MKDFNRGGGFRDKRGGGGFERRDSGSRGGGFNRGGSGGGFDRPAMHQATCAECGQSCEVPFKPTGERPVYCSNCFKNRDEGAPRRDDRHEHRSESRFDGRPEKHEFSKPVVNNNSFSNEQFETLNAKLDKILRTLSSAPTNFAPKAAQISETLKEAAKKIEIKVNPIVKEIKKEAKKIIKKSVAAKAKPVAKKKKK
jgi:CxxC-x17-CxxC domain-containing protein